MGPRDESNGGGCYHASGARPAFRSCFGAMHARQIRGPARRGRAAPGSVTWCLREFARCSRGGHAGARCALLVWPSRSIHRPGSPRIGSRSAAVHVNRATPPSREASCVSLRPDDIGAIKRGLLALGLLACMAGTRVRADGVRRQRALQQQRAPARWPASSPAPPAPARRPARRAPPPRTLGTVTYTHNVYADPLLPNAPYQTERRSRTSSRRRQPGVRQRA